jgi:hypothetical protein
MKMENVRFVREEIELQRIIAIANKILRIQNSIKMIYKVGIVLNV